MTASAPHTTDLTTCSDRDNGRPSGRGLTHRRFGLALGACAMGVAAGPSRAATDFPTQTITIVVPSPPGGPNDVLARLLAEHLRKAWGQTVLVDNRPGASGALGAQAVARSQPNGYNLLMASTGFLTTAVLNPKIGYDPFRDFTPVSLLATTGGVLAFNPKLPIRNWAEFLRYVRGRPDGVSMGNAGIGSSNHFYSEMIAEATGLKIHAVPYRGEAAMLGELTAGTLDFGLISMGAYRNLQQAGKVHGIAVTLAQRSPALPDLPTLVELGVPRVGSARGWFGLLAPARTPADVVQKLVGQIQAILRQPEMRTRLLDEYALTSLATTADEFATILRSEHAVWVESASRYGIKLE